MIRLLIPTATLALLAVPVAASPVPMSPILPGLPVIGPASPPPTACTGIACGPIQRDG